MNFWSGIRNSEVEQRVKPNNEVKTYKLSKQEIEEKYGPVSDKKRKGGYSVSSQRFYEGGKAMVFNVELVKKEIGAGLDKEGIKEKYKDKVKGQLIGRMYALAIKQMKNDKEDSKEEKKEAREEIKVDKKETKEIDIGNQNKNIALEKTQEPVVEEKVLCHSSICRVVKNIDLELLGGARW